MNKKEFMAQLKSELKLIKTEDLKQILQYYDELISDGIENGKNEEAVISELDKPAEIAAKFIENGMDNNCHTDYKSPNEYCSTSEELNKIIIEAENIPVELHQTSTKNVYVKYRKTDNEEITVVEQNGIFTFRHHIKHTLFGWMGFLSIGRCIIVEIPEAFKGDLQIITSNARILADKISGVNIMQLKTSNAKIVAEGCLSYKLDIKTSNASVNISDSNSKICSAVSSNGHISLYKDTFQTQCSVSTGNAPISCENLQSDNINFTTGNASIHGTIAGDARDYTIKSSTTNGSNNLPADWSFKNQSKHLFAKTSNARIDLRFING